jgi:hypothetical protein
MAVLRFSATPLVVLQVFVLGSAWAGVVSTLQVSVQVLPHARLVGSDAGDTVTVTVADLVRGHVDVTHRYQLHTNAPERVAVQLRPRIGLARAIDIEGFGAPVRLLDTSLELTPPATGEFELAFRIWLPRDMTAGDYPLPWQIAAIVH